MIIAWTKQIKAQEFLFVDKKNNNVTLKFSATNHCLSFESQQTTEPQTVPFYNPKNKSIPAALHKHTRDTSLCVLSPGQGRNGNFGQQVSVPLSGTRGHLRGDEYHP